MNKHTFLLDIVTPYRKVFSDQAESVSVPTSRGTIGILPGHMPLVSLLAEGEIKVATASSEYFLAIGEGFIEIGKNSVEILVSRAYNADELNEAEIKKAQLAALEILTKKLKDNERGEAYALLRRSIIEMKVVSRKRRSKQNISMDSVIRSAH